MQDILLFRQKPGILYEDDSITTMDKIAETTRAKFERHGIATVLDTKMISAATISVAIWE
jgi:hypothetical protein